MERIDTTESKQIELKQRAADHFEIDVTDVEPKHVQFIKDQDFALNYGYQGNPLLTYQVDESGVVEFIYGSSETLADQFDHRFGNLKTK